MEGQTSESVIFGIRPVAEAIRAEKPIQKIMIREDVNTEPVRMIIKSAGYRKTPVVRVPVERLNRLSKGRNHQGVVALVASAEFSDLNEIMDNIEASGTNPLILLSDKITDVRNFGAIARSAECAGVDAIVVPAKGAASMGADAMKTSAGALNRIPVCRVPNLKSAIYLLKQKGIRIAAATEKAENYYFDVDFRLPTAIIVGAEDTGISSTNLNLADIKIKIPLVGQIESLNVSAATAVILFEVVRQRMKPA